MSILRYLGIRYGYYPSSDPEQAWACDSAMDATKDAIDVIAKLYWVKDAELKEKMTKDFISGPYPQFLAALNKRLETSGQHQFLVGDKLSTADFLLSAFIFTLIYNELKAAEWDFLTEIFEKYEHLVRYAEHKKELFKDYLETRVKCPR